MSKKKTPAPASQTVSREVHEKTVAELKAAKDDIAKLKSALERPQESKNTIEILTALPYDAENYHFKLSKIPASFSCIKLKPKSAIGLQLFTDAQRNAGIDCSYRQSFNDLFLRVHDIFLPRE